MKASNPKVMIQAYRLLCARFDELGYDYPLHLGVTEAGAGEDGRLKSSVGIGSLLEDGIGDTVRVSLTEDSIHEIPVVYDLIRRFTPHPSEPNPRFAGKSLKPLAGPLPEVRMQNARREETYFNFYEYSRFPTETYALGGVKLGGAEPGRVQVALSRIPDAELSELKAALALDSTFDPQNAAAEELKGKIRAELVEMPHGEVSFVRAFLASLRALDFPVVLVLRLPQATAALLETMEPQDYAAVPPPAGAEELAFRNQLKDFTRAAAKKEIGIEWVVGENDLPAWALARWGKGPEAYAELQLQLIRAARENGVGAVLPSFELNNPTAAYRYLVQLLHEHQLHVPVLIREPHSCPLTPDDLRTATVFGSLLCDGIGDAVAIAARDRTPYARVRLAYNTLQAAGNRVTKTEFISCPSCGRTLFNLQETTERIRSKMGHLKGLKLAIMGCIVNGPGEMADAHFGYVGAGPGRINLYVGKELVKKNIPQEEADARLIDLIREHGMWQDPG
jgi:(E)-4-hydroxy-3-methylbut-2-enyl-diphosphate synthase